MQLLEEEPGLILNWRGRQRLPWIAVTGWTMRITGPSFIPGSLTAELSSSLIYVCHYRSSSSTRTRINRRVIAELEKHKDIQLAFNTLTVLAGTQSGGNAAQASSITATELAEVSTAELSRSFLAAAVFG